MVYSVKGACNSSGERQRDSLSWAMCFSVAVMADLSCSRPSGELNHSLAVWSVLFFADLLMVISNYPISHTNHRELLVFG